MYFSALNSSHTASIIQELITKQIIFSCRARIFQIELSQGERMLMSGVILKLVTNGRMFITGRISHTDLAFDKKFIVFKRGVNWTFDKRSFRIVLVEGFQGLVPMGKTIIIAHE